MEMLFALMILFSGVMDQATKPQGLNIVEAEYVEPGTVLIRDEPFRLWIYCAPYGETVVGGRLIELGTREDCDAVVGTLRLAIRDKVEQRQRRVRWTLGVLGIVAAGVAVGLGLQWRRYVE